MAKKKGCDCEPGLPGWMATFSDMMTLLLTFFVLLLSMSSLDQQKLKEALGSLKGALGVLQGGTKTDVNVRELMPSLEIVDVPPRRLIDKSYEKVRLQIYRGELAGKVEADRTEEGDTPCLGVVPGDTKLLPAGLKVPHMGWNTVQHSDDELFKGIPQDTYFYFVHSFAVPDYTHTLARCDYGGTFSAAIKKNNFYGVQFHPERSGEAGAQLLTNFVNL